MPMSGAAQGGVSRVRAIRPGWALALTIGLAGACTDARPPAAEVDGDGPRGCAGAAVDLRQARAMATFLARWSAGEDAGADVAALVELPGTALVVEQMNLARRVDVRQYRDLLQALAAGAPPSIEPVDTTERARRGVVGLTRDVADLLVWGRDHVGALRAGLDLLDGRPSADLACRRALANLPEPVPLAPSFNVVMGGRAGAAALSDGQLYVDALISTRLALDAGGPTLDPERVVSFFAHEAHHVGLSGIIGAGRADLSLDAPGAFAFRVLTLLALEGSATYLVDWEADADRGLVEPDFAPLLADRVTLLEDVQGILSSVLRDSVDSAERFDALTASMVGNRYHAAGAVLAAEIDARLGRERLMAALRDPRRLLSDFNEAVAREGGDGSFRFDGALASDLLTLGSRAPSPGDPTRSRTSSPARS